MVKENNERPFAVRIISILLFLFGIFALLGSLFMWGEGFILPLTQGVNYRFPITDILVNAPASIIAAIGLWKYKQYGYIISQFVSGFYIYASMEIFVETLQSGPPYAIEILFPQILASILAVIMVFYFWKNQSIFSK